MTLGRMADLFEGNSHYLEMLEKQCRLEGKDEMADYVKLKYIEGKNVPNIIQEDDDAFGPVRG